jgi:hypothetical protein
MPIPEPTGYYLWADVHPPAEWPTSDEDLMQVLANGWDEAGAAFVDAASPDNGMTDGWLDSCGADFLAKLDKLRKTFGYDGEAMRSVGVLAREYGNDVRYAKQEITTLIANNEIPYAFLKSILVLAGNNAAIEAMAAELADDINVFLDQVAERIQTRSRGAPELDRPELTWEGELVSPPAEGEVVPTPVGNPPVGGWAPPNAPTDVLEFGEEWEPGEGTPVIGRLPDTMYAGQWPGHTYLQVEEWSLAKNDAWIQTVIDGGGSVYVASSLEGNGADWEEAGRPTVLAREVRQLLQAGYTWNGNFLVPPPR